MATDASDWEQQRQELDAEPWDWVSSELAPLPLAEGACQRGLGRQLGMSTRSGPTVMA